MGEYIRELRYATIDEEEKGRMRKYMRILFICSKRYTGKINQKLRASVTSRQKGAKNGKGICLELVLNLEPCGHIKAVGCAQPGAARPVDVLCHFSGPPGRELTWRRAASSCKPAGQGPRDASATPRLEPAPGVQRGRFKKHATLILKRRRRVPACRGSPVNCGIFITVDGPCHR